MRTAIDALLGRLQADNGQTMAEYALVSSILLIVAVSAFLLIGPRIATLVQLGVDAFP